MYKSAKIHTIIVMLLLTTQIINNPCSADIITDWNIKARNIVVASKLNTPYANRTLAIVHTAIYQAVNAITHEYPDDELSIKVDTQSNASIEAAVAAANRITLLSLLPQAHDVIEKEYHTSLKLIDDQNNKKIGIEIGERAAKKVLSVRTEDNTLVKDNYRPSVIAGKYVPTLIPAVPNWPQRKTWILKDPSEFRPGPPPKLTSKEWANDLNEVKIIGKKISNKRSSEQTKIAKFWEATLPPIYHGVVHSVANMKGRSVTQNAWLFATITRATDDAMISVFDAKYHYGLWRPITAIRNADIDNNSETFRDSSWEPYIPTPMHPEYPCAHCVIAGTVGSILQAEIEKGHYDNIVLMTRSTTLNNSKRSWNSIDEFVQEVSEARIYDGVHYRNSTEVGTAMGKKIGALALKKYTTQ